jgi:hypothetical protein
MRRAKSSPAAVISVFLSQVWSRARETKISFIKNKNKNNVSKTRNENKDTPKTSKSRGFYFPARPGSGEARP